MDGIDKWKEKENTGIAELRKDPKKGFGKLVESIETKMARSKRENMEELSARKLHYTDWLVVTGRWAVIVFLALYGIIIWGFSSVDFSVELSSILHPAWKYFFIVILWGVINGFYHQAGGPGSRNAALGRIGCDILLLLFVVHYTGGGGSFCFALFILVSVEAALQLRGTLLPLAVSAVATIAFGLLLAGEAASVLEHIPVFTHEALFPLSDLALFLFSGLLNFMSVVVVSHITGENRKNSEKLLVRVDQDVQTGTFNRKVLFVQLASEIERCSRSHQALSVLLLGIDNMEDYNRKLGYQEGDKLLAAVGDTIKKSIRSNFREEVGSKDLACRYSGDIFAVILPEAKPSYDVGEMRKIKEQKHFHGVYLVAERLQYKLAELTGVDGPVRVSVGGAHWPYHGNTSDELVKEAYRALAEAKSQGKNKIVVAAKGV